MRQWVVLVLFLLALGTLRMVACGEEDRSCVDDENCDDGNPCTEDRCISYDPNAPLCEVVQRCRHSPVAGGTSCGSGKVCVHGVCRENPCEGVVCDDDDVCTDDHCDYVDGSCYVTPTMCDDQNECTEGVCDLADGCTFTPVEDRRNCHPDVSSPIGVCKAGACVALPTDACTNPEDLAVVCDLGFLDEVETCARDAIGDPDAIGDLGATAPCLVENTSVSADCASCYGAVVICIFENCVLVCAPVPNSQACDDCQAEYGCDTLLADCTGDLAGECDTGGTMFDVGAFEAQP